MCKIDKIRIEEKSSYMREQYDQLKEQNMKLQEDFDHKLKEK